MVSYHSLMGAVFKVLNCVLLKLMFKPHNEGCTTQVKKQASWCWLKSDGHPQYTQMVWFTLPWVLLAGSVHLYWLHGMVKAYSTVGERPRHSDEIVVAMGF